MPTPARFIGVRNYTRLLQDPEIWGYFQTTAYFVVLAVAAQFFIGFGLALLLNREFRYKGFVTTLLLLPMMLSPVVVGLFWRFILFSDNSGLLNFLPQFDPEITDRLDDESEDGDGGCCDCRYMDVVTIYDAHRFGGIERRAEISLRSR